MTTTRVPVVYRCYDAHGRLIYIGSSESMERRLICHRSQSWWNGLVARIAYERHEDIASARAAEWAAIAAESPAFNIARRPGRLPNKPFPLTAADALVCRDWHDRTSGWLPVCLHWVRRDRQSVAA